MLPKIFSHGTLVAECWGRGVAFSDAGWIICSSCWFPRGFSSGQSVAYQCQRATTRKASEAEIANETLQPQWIIVQAIAMGVSVPPRPRPQTCNPLAKPRSRSAVHEAITRVTLEETAASPTPVRKRTIRKTASALIPVAAANFGAKTIAPDPTAKQKIDAVKGRRGPMRSQTYPHGI